MYLIRKIKPEEVGDALLALEVFMQFEAPDYCSEGVDTFKRDVINNDNFIRAEGLIPRRLRRELRCE